MTTTASLLDGIQIAKPCTANWDEMTGDEKVRRCALCKLDVYDISSMKRDEAEAFVASRLGVERTCIRFFRRADGTVLTRDCPVGVRAAWKKVMWIAAALFAGGFAAAAMFVPRGADGVPQVTPLKQIDAFVRKQLGQPPAPAPVLLQGDVLAPTPAPATVPAPTPDVPTPTMGEATAPVMGKF